LTRVDARTGKRMNLLVNIDVPDLAAAQRFYQSAFGLEVGRRFGDDAVELLGAGVPIYLLRKPAGTDGAGGAVRDYARHWSPLHCDLAVEDLDGSLARAIAAGAQQEGATREASWGRIVQLADPFGHGWCLIQFSAAGYDAIAT
jgi:predicted enzyme related to lactoylglutathione lyase